MQQNGNNYFNIKCNVICFTMEDNVASLEADVMYCGRGWMRTKAVDRRSTQTKCLDNFIQSTLPQFNPLFKWLATCFYNYIYYLLALTLTWHFALFSSLLPTRSLSWADIDREYICFGGRLQVTPIVDHHKVVMLLCCHHMLDFLSLYDTGRRGILLKTS